MNQKYKHHGKGKENWQGESEKREIKKESMLQRKNIERFGFSKKEYFQYIFSVKKCANIDNILMKEKFQFTVYNIRLNKYMADDLNIFSLNLIDG